MPVKSYIVTDNDESLLSFPCDFPIKAMGKTEDDFDALVVGLIRNHCPDILEGAISITLDLIVQQLIAGNCLFRADLKQRFCNFMYGKSDVRNSPKSANISLLGMSAAEAWCVFRLFPFIVGDAVLLNNESWELYISCQNL